MGTHILMMYTPPSASPRLWIWICLPDKSFVIDPPFSFNTTVLPTAVTSVPAINGRSMSATCQGNPQGAPSSSSHLPSSCPKLGILELSGPRCFFPARLIGLGVIGPGKIPRGVTE